MLRQSAQRLGQQSGFALIAQRCFADGPLAAAKPVDWNAIYNSGFKDEEKKELAAFRNTLTEVQERLSQLSKPVKKIDWEDWKTKVNPEIVEAFRKEFDSIKIPKYDGTAQMAELNAKFAQYNQLAQSMKSHAEQTLSTLEKELAEIQQQKKRLATVTVDEELAANPKRAEQIDKEIEEKNFMIVS